MVKGIQKKAAEQCAPVMFGIKPSNLLIIDPCYDPVLMSVVAGAGLKIRCFYFDRGRQIWFMYNEMLLGRYLDLPENRAFMSQYGYMQGMTVNQILKHAARRFRRYKKGEIGFPHEMGILLGYPLCDVRGFIENEGKNYLCTGYWKVYANEEQAKKTFSRYARAKELALQMVRSGVEIQNCRRYQMAV
jgi:hypothetical protein